MSDFIFENPIYFPVIFVLGWLTITTILSLISGWFVLMRKFPDRPELPLLTLKNQSGLGYNVGMQRILNLSVCPSGLRIGMSRIFGPFNRPFFVPWEAMSVTTKTIFFQRFAKISFAQSSRNLLLPAEVVERLARASDGRWPEGSSIPEETYRQAAARIFKQWILLTCLMSTFFIAASRQAPPNQPAPIPMAFPILLPAIAIGIVSFARYIGFWISKGATSKGW